MWAPLVMLLGLVGVTEAKKHKKDSHDYLYMKNFLPPLEFRRLKDVCLKVESLMKDDPRSITERRMYSFKKYDYAPRLLNSRYVCEKMKSFTVGPTSIPIEYRVYSVGGHMDWHRDVQLFLFPQYEIVLTLENSSDSETQIVDPKTGEVVSISSEPNSVLIVRANSAFHRVTPVTKGRRTIVKFAYH